MSQYISVTKKELASSQHNVALSHFIADEEYPAVIALAGAAEEKALLYLGVVLAME